MADHTELVAELPYVERLTNQERLKHAKKRRVQQLKRWSQKEREHMYEENKRKLSANSVGAVSKSISLKMESKNKKARRNVIFTPSITLLEAASRNDIDEVQSLLSMGMDPDSTNEDGLTALHQCCIDNNEELMRMLLDYSANVNAEDSEKWTPLHAAATCGHLALVKYLIQKGANLLAVNADGNMPYDICEDDTTLDFIETEMSNQGVTQDLIDSTRMAMEMEMLTDLKQMDSRNKDLEARDQQGATPLHVAAANGYMSVVEYLLLNKVTADVADQDLWTPLHAAACWGHGDVLEALVQHGADLNARTKNGETPLDICEDADLKERILHIRNELEIRKLSQQQQRLRRTHSQNTRSQSVRRVSVRDKSHIGRKDAMEEAKIRLSLPPSNQSAPSENGSISDVDNPKQHKQGQQNPTNQKWNFMDGWGSSPNCRSGPSGDTNHFNCDSTLSHAASDLTVDLSIHLRLNSNNNNGGVDPSADKDGVVTLSSLKRNRMANRSGSYSDELATKEVVLANGASQSMVSYKQTKGAVSPGMVRKYSGDLAMEVVNDAPVRRRSCFNCTIL